MRRWGRQVARDDAHRSGRHRPRPPRRLHSSHSTQHAPRLCLRARFCRAYRFRHPALAPASGLGMCDVTFTAVAGHLTELDFPASHKGWRSVDPAALYDAPVAKRVPEDKKGIERNLATCSRAADVLLLWLDCDREGENIAFEVMAVCTQANPRLRVLRAHFSSLSAPEIGRALATLGPPNAADAAAVDVRQEIDLRVGASFTRLQSLLLQDKFDWGAADDGRGDVGRLISYGPCQFPTLGLIVLRQWDIRAHVEEVFWTIHLAVAVPGGGAGGDGGGGRGTRPPATRASSSPGAVAFKWSRDRLFDHAIATALFEDARAAGDAVVTAVDGRACTREPPRPLSTLELQKAATRPAVLGLPGDRVMKLAEELYHAG